MNIAVIGAGPAGLYFSCLLKMRRPDARVRVLEQNPAEATFGFGVVFSDRALEFIRADDPETYDLITPRMESWSDITLDLCNEMIRLDGVGFSAIGRLELLRLLRERAQSGGVEIEHRHTIHGRTELGAADLIVGADGANSIVRQMNEAAFGTTVTLLTNKFAWFGTKKPFETLTQTFRRNADGCFNAHHYRYSPAMSTFIVETDQETWRRARFAEMSLPATEKYLEKVFEDVLQEHALISNRSVWRSFPIIANAHWSVGNTVLVGDALHTAHFSIGSGTRLAMEDAIALVAALDRNWSDIRGGLAAYEALRRPVAEKITDAACASAGWYERFGEHMDLPPAEFAMSYLGRTGRLDRERLSRVAPKFMAVYEASQREACALPPAQRMDRR